MARGAGGRRRYSHPVTVSLAGGLLHRRDAVPLALPVATAKLAGWSGAATRGALIGWLVVPSGLVMVTVGLVLATPGPVTFTARSSNS